MRVVVIGQGYVGETAAVSFAKNGHRVTGLESSEARLSTLQSGRAGVVEPGLDSAIEAEMRSGHLDFVHDERQLPEEPVDAVLISVGTPPLPGGGADLSYVRAALNQALRLQPAAGLVVVTSTIPPGTSDRLLSEFATVDPTLRDRFVHNPVFFSQGKALEEWRRPHRLVFGTHNHALRGMLEELYCTHMSSTPVLVMNPASAEFVKYGSNNALAVAISFINQMTASVEKRGAIIDDVVAGMGYDPRILRAILPAGLGFGDSCLIKDLLAMAGSARDIGEILYLVDAAYRVNEQQRQVPIDFMVQRFGVELAHKKVAIIGLSNEPLSDDMRKAPSISIVAQLVPMAGEVATWDPLLSGALQDELFPGAVRYQSIRDAVEGADIALILTEYEQVLEADWTALAATMSGSRIVFDARNCLPIELLKSEVLEYFAFGRPLTDERGITVRSVATRSTFGGNPYFGHITDIWKHLLFANALAIEGPQQVVETHAGAATYDMPASDADPGRSYGVRHFLKVSGTDPVLAASRFRQQLLEGRQGEYLGSPALAMRELGRNATYVFFDLSPQCRANLQEEGGRLGLSEHVAIRSTDGLGGVWVHAASVADPSRVVVHIDPFEPKDAPSGLTSSQLAAKLGDLGFKVLFWYPFADPAEEGQMERTVKSAMTGPTDRVWAGEITMRVDSSRFPISPLTGKGNLAGCGILAINLSPASNASLTALGGALVDSYRKARLPDGSDGGLRLTTSAEISVHRHDNDRSASGPETGVLQ